jgi:hypothetical protein
VDKNNLADKLAGVMLAGGASTLIVLSGTQLSNREARSASMNPAGVQIQGVSHSKDDGVESGFVRFNTGA